MTKKRVNAKWKTIIRLTCGLVALGLLVAAVVAASQVRDVTLTESQIQQKLDRRLPFTKHGLKVNQVKVKLADAVQVFIDVEGLKLGQPFALQASAKGQVRYAAGAGSFYLTPQALHVERFSLRGRSLGQASDEAVKKTLGSRAINEEVDDLAKARGLKGALGRFLKQKRDVLAADPAAAASRLQHKVEGLVVTVAKAGLTRVPIYTLPNDLKGNVARLMITGLETHDRQLTVHLSFWRLGLTVIILLGLVALFVLLVIFAPEVLGLFVEFAVAIGDGLT